MDSVQNSNQKGQTVVVTMTECSEKVQVVGQNDDVGFMVLGTSKSDSNSEEGVVGAGLLGSAALIASSDEELLSNLSESAMEEMVFSESNSFAQSEESSYSEAQAEEEEDEASASFFGTESMEGDSLLSLLGIGAGAGVLSGIGGGGGSSDSTPQTSPSMDDEQFEDDEGDVAEPSPIPEQPSEEFQQVEPTVPSQPVDDTVEQPADEVVDPVVEDATPLDGNLSGTPLGEYEENLNTTPSSNEFELGFDRASPISSEQAGDFVIFDPVVV